MKSFLAIKCIGIDNKTRNDRQKTRNTNKNIPKNTEMPTAIQTKQAQLLKTTANIKS